MNEKKGVTLIELAVVAGIFLLMILVLVPFVRMVKARSGRIKCSANLRAVSLGLHAYAFDHEGRFPGQLGDIYPKYAGDEKAFDCPATRAPGTPADPEYLYTAGLTETSPLREIIVRDRKSSHGRAGYNALRIDGSVDLAR